MEPVQRARVQSAVGAVIARPDARRPAAVLAKHRGGRTGLPGATMSPGSPVQHPEREAEGERPPTQRGCRRGGAAGSRPSAQGTGPTPRMPEGQAWQKEDHRSGSARSAKKVQCRGKGERKGLAAVPGAEMAQPKQQRYEITVMMKQLSLVIIAIINDDL